jgi:hypothetical protein
MEVLRKTRVLEGYPADNPPLEQLMNSARPAVLKGLIKDWPLVRAGLGSAQEAMDYLRSFYNGKTIGTCVGEPGIGGRPFYNSDFTELNTAHRRMRLDEVLNLIREHLHEDHPPTFYIPSTTIDGCLPGFRQENAVSFAAHGIEPIRSIWIGNRTIASCHYDAPMNLACCAVGRRRVTLFPPEQIVNLYPGPLEPTPGGQAVSVVNFANPDFARYPRFREALVSAQVAELAPGDAVYIPSMWWHHVEALSPFNTLVNYWWHSVPAHVPTPMNALQYAMWTLRDRPESEKRAWKAVFEYYVFGPSDRAGEHLPEQARGALGPMDEDKARQLRAMLLNALNR